MGALNYYNYYLTHNESAEEDNSENFQFTHNNQGTVRMENFEDVFNWMKENWKYLSNGEWYWECDDAGTKGEVRFHNCEDGMVVVFEVVRVPK